MDLNSAAEQMLLSANLAQLASVNKRGDPSVCSVWYLYGDGLIWISTSNRTEKGRNLTQGSAAALTIVDKLDFYKQLIIKGRVQGVVDDAEMHYCDKISMKYLGRPFPYRNTPGRIAIGIHLVRWNYHIVRL